MKLFSFKKRLHIVLPIFFFLLPIAVFFIWNPSSEVSAAEELSQKLLRFHVIANSDSEEDQADKYLVRDAVVAYLTPVVAEAETREEAEAALDDCLPGLVKTAEQVLEKNGFFYGARAEIREEEFPTRVYGEYTLEAGVYRALIVSLGTGTGDNWWCVVYPPLCFAGEPGDSVVYRSKILEIIRSWKKNH